MYNTPMGLNGSVQHMPYSTLVLVAAAGSLSAQAELDARDKESGLPR